MYLKCHRIYYSVVICEVVLENTTFSSWCIVAWFYPTRVTNHLPSAWLCYRQRPIHQRSATMLIRECTHHMLVVMLISWYICRIQFLQKHLGNWENNLQICEKVLSKIFHSRQQENLHKTCQLHPVKRLWFINSKTQMYWTELKYLVITITVVIVIIIIIIVTTTAIIR